MEGGTEEEEASNVRGNIWCEVLRIGVVEGVRSWLLVSVWRWWPRK